MATPPTHRPSRRRRSLHPTPEYALAEGTIEVRPADVGRIIALSLMGGPPLAAVELWIGDRFVAPLQLDALGGAFISQVWSSPGDLLELRHVEKVFMRGHVPSFP